MKCFKVTWVIIIIVCAGCASTRAIILNNENSISGLPLITPADYERKLAATQILKIVYDRKSYDFLAQVEVDEQKLVLVVLSLQGKKLFQIIYSGGKVEYQTWIETLEFDPVYLLADFSVIFAPISTLRKHSADNGLLLLFESMNYTKRHISGDGIDIQIEYSKPDPWQGKIVYNNKSRQYSIEINTVSIKPL